MKLNEVVGPYQPNQSDKLAVVMKYPNIYKDKNVYNKHKVRREKVIVKSSGTGKIYSERTVFQTY